VIKKHFDVPQVATYFAINMCLSHWDGFFNNYFAYHDSSGSGLWRLYPWDQDKTWGFYDGIPEGEVFFDMPLTFGMEGERPPGWPQDRPPPRGFGAGPRWWRPGGYFSKPLLANPSFRKLFLARTKEILETIYTADVFYPLIDQVGDRLQDEVRIRAATLHENPDEAVQRLRANLQSLKDHLAKRRNFLLDQDEIKSAGKVAESK
jgi:spore coat protein CotH